MFALGKMRLVCLNDQRLPGPQYQFFAVISGAVLALAAAIVSDNATNDIEAVAVKVWIVERTNRFRVILILCGLSNGVI